MNTPIQTPRYTELLPACPPRCPLSAPKRRSVSRAARFFTARLGANESLFAPPPAHCRDGASWRDVWMYGTRKTMTCAKRWKRIMA